jgi:hypothetical protein
MNVTKVGESSEVGTDWLKAGCFGEALKSNIQGGQGVRSSLSDV